MNGRGPSIRYKRTNQFNERSGILTTPSTEFLKRRQNAELQRRLGAALRLESTSTFNQVTRQKPEDIELPSEPAIEDLGTELVLPIEKYRTEIVDMILHNKASGIVSETGGGKTTQVPQFLIDAGVQHVYIGEPRRVTVDGPGARVQYELEQRLGMEEAEGMVDTIHGGRAVRFENSRISFATAASLLRMLPDIEKQAELYPDELIVICIDEIHEQDPYIEALFATAGIIASRHNNIHIVCMSATMNEDVLKTPLGRITNFEHPEEVEIPFVHVEGRPFKYTAHEAPGYNPAEAFLEFGANSRVAGLVDRGFLPLKRIKEAVIDGHEARAPGSSSRLIFREFSGRMSTAKREEIVRLAESLEEGSQIVVIGTPAMESGVTIPGMDFLAFGGMINREKRREDRGRGTVIEYAAKAEVIQFFGRAGRDVDNAHVYLCDAMPSQRSEKEVTAFKKLYPYRSMDKRDDYPEPNITNFSELLLLGIGAGARPEQFNKHIINEQTHKALYEAVDRLRLEFGAIDDDDTLTEIGKLMSRFPVAPELARGLAEAMLQGRSKDQLARMAIIATAIDTGGYQLDRVTMENANWKGLLRRGSTDDFIAQFDFWDAFESRGVGDYASYDGFMVASEYDLDYNRYLGADEATKKTLQRLGLDPRKLSIDPPSHTEIDQIRNDFTAGMYALTYRETAKGKRGADDKDYYFNPIVDAQEHPQRTLLRSSVLEPKRGEVVAGMPTFREKISKDKKSVTEVELLGSTLKVSHEAVGHYALAGGMVTYRTVPGTSRVDGGMVREGHQGVFGSMNVGSHVTDKDLRRLSIEITDGIPPESRRQLVEAVQKNPGIELRELRSIAETLAEYRRLLPPEIIDMYRYENAPVDITLGHITTLLENYAHRTRNIQEVDQLIGAHVASNGLSVSLYYSTSAQQEMLARSPEYINLGSGIQPLRVLYSNGRPYATNVSKEQLAAIKGPLYVDEGFENPREVLHQIKKQPRGTRQVSFGSGELL